ncbi:MAG TPA: hypothetical protein VK550_03005 [Polyangiaceae bacterium]|nr:hypothetical protein [Polyangiaceae bacterium]
MTQRFLSVAGVGLGLATFLLASCGARTVQLDGTPSDAGFSNPNSTPDAIGPGVSVVIEEQETAMKIAVDKTRVYWLSRLPAGYSAAEPARYSRVRSCQKSDCPSTIVTYDSATFDATGALPLQEFYELTVRDDNVYWARYTGGPRLSILTCPSVGCAGAPKIVVGDVDVTSIAVDATHVYWASRRDTAILRRPLTGSSVPQAIALNENTPDEILVDATHVYWIANWGSANATIKRVSKQGGEPAVTLVTDQNQASSLALDDTFFYWANSYSVGTISRCPLSGCLGAPTVLVADQNRPSALVTDGASIFWTSVTDESSHFQTLAAVKRCRVDSCASATDTLAVQMFAWMGMSMALDASDVYWLAQGAEERAGNGFYPHASIYRHAK